jgi:hypothetical protein
MRRLSRLTAVDANVTCPHVTLIGMDAVYYDRYSSCEVDVHNLPQIMAARIPSPGYQQLCAPAKKQVAFTEGITLDKSV